MFGIPCEKTFVCNLCLQQLRRGSSLFLVGHSSGTYNNLRRICFSQHVPTRQWMQMSPTPCTQRHQLSAIINGCLLAVFLPYFGTIPINPSCDQLPLHLCTVYHHCSLYWFLQHTPWMLSYHPRCIRWLQYFFRLLHLLLQLLACQENFPSVSLWALLHLVSILAALIAACGFLQLCNSSGSLFPFFRRGGLLSNTEALNFTSEKGFVSFIVHLSLDEIHTLLFGQSQRQSLNALLFSGDVPSSWEVSEPGQQGVQDLHHDCSLRCRFPKINQLVCHLFHIIDVIDHVRIRLQYELIESLLQ